MVLNRRVITLATIFFIATFQNSAIAQNKYLIDVDSFPGVDINKSRIPANPERAIRRANNTFKNNQGETRYTIHLDPFYMQNFQERAVAHGYKMPTKEMASSKKEINLEQPGVAMVASELSQKYGFKVYSSNSWLEQTISAYLSERVAREIANERFVMYVSEDEFDESNVVSYTDTIVDNGVLVPWYFHAISRAGKDGAYPDFYFIDFPLITNNISNQINSLPPDNVGDSYLLKDSRHATFIATLVGAKGNPNQLRGINPGQTIAPYGVNSRNCGIDAYGECSIDTSSILTSMDRATGRAELLGQYPVLNMSINWRDPSNNIWEYTKQHGLAIRKASNRFLVSQSAGNQKANACNHAFNYQGAARENDGIIVVGGLKQDMGLMGSKGANDVTGPAPGEGTNYGPCVDVWAPGAEIKAYDVDGTIKSSTGTSYAAPIAAAVASSFGRDLPPVLRESILRAQATNVGWDPSGYPMMAVKKSAASPALKKIPIQALYSAWDNTNINTVRDGKFYDLSAFWNPGAYQHQISLDLGGFYNIKGVRVTMRTNSPNPDPMNFAVYGSTYNFQAPETQIGTFTEPSQADGAPVFIPTSGTARYIQLTGYNPTSWLAYSEIEVYGY